MADNSPRTQRVKKKRKRLDSDKDEIKAKSSKRLAMEPESEANVKDTTEKEAFKNAEAFEESDSSDEETCGMKRPNLLEQLKTILDTYPDDAQIIKELIQNAEDADANEIKLLHDKRVIQPDGEYGKYLKAPALCVYNDAKFTDEDWDGIISIYNSIKKNNKLKVGRFGLGFKSVFHMTDHPVIISGDRMLVIDPVKSIVSEKDVCITQRLKRLKKPKYNKSLSIILDTFGFHQHVLDAGQYNGTLFWFPLRSETSKLSDNIYTEKKITDLFVTFEEEAPLVLIFLKSLAQVKVFQRTDRLNHEELYAVTMSGEIKDMKERQRFKQEVQQLNGELPAEPLWCTFETKIMSISGGETVESNWVIVNYIQGTNESQDSLKNLAMDSDLSYSPFVGVAYPVKYSSYTDAGHVFCFLPLPLEQKSLTGLPVHVNGFFALEQNRRHVKWASKEQANVIANRDKNVTWNELLIKEVLPRAYERLVLHLKHTCENQKTDVLRVYRSIPVPSAIDDKWEGILDELLTSLLRQEIFFTENNGGRWINQSDAVFPIFNPANNVQNIEDVITKIILQAGKNFVPIPNSLIEILKEQRYNNITPTEITPTYVRDVLRTCSDYTSYTREEKLSLLIFVGTDGTDSALAELDGLELIPLHDGSFGRFQLHGIRENIILCDMDEADLFLGLGHKLISTIHLPDEVVTILRQIAESGIYQISAMTSDKFSTLYSDTITTNCLESERRKVFVPSCNDLNLTWLGKIWEYIEQHIVERESGLESLGHLPLIAEKILESENIKELYPLKGFYISCHCDGMTSLPQDLISVLPLLSITKVAPLPNFLKHILGKFIKYPNCENLLHLLSDVLKQADAKQIIQSFNDNCQPKCREAFVDFICSHVTDGTPSDVRSVLRNLQIFHLSSNVVFQANTSKMYVSLEENNSIEPRTNIPVPYPYPLIEPKNPEIEKLALKLGAHTKDTLTLVKEILQQMQDKTIKKQYHEEHKQTFMIYYLHNIASFDESSIKLAHGVTFIPSTSSQLLCAKAFFDPRDQNLQMLFHGEKNKFPASPYQTEDVLNALSKIGLKQWNDLTTSDLIETARILDTAESGSCQIFLKAEKLLQFLEKLSENIRTEKNDLHAITELRWVPVMQKPATYPECLPWFADENKIRLSKPKDIVASRFCKLSGSVRPIVDVQEHSKLTEYLNWNVSPTVEIISKQLECIADCFQPRYKPQISSCISEIYTHLSSVPCKLESLEYTRCVMCEDSFRYPADVFIKTDKDHETLNLNPYISKLPNEFVHLSDFFLAIGCKDKLDFQIAITVLEKIREKHMNTISTTDTKTDMSLVIQILRYIDSLNLSFNDLKNVLLPVFDKEKRLVLKYPSECTYSDGDNEWLVEDSDKECIDEDINYIHRDIGPNLATRFGVPSLTNRFLTDDDSDEMVVEWGQSEPLTTRLKNLLDGYSDGFAIPKEIIQNADDAGASRVAFLYDERENMNARTRLIDAGMAEVQGPALWTYNDAIFQESDFNSIIKLGGRTKENDKSTIGKFGLGFCSVYNLTDVPSFVSGNSMVILDPHGSHLGKAIKDKNNPGIRIRLNKKILKNLQNQFKPFNNIFGCDLTGVDGNQTRYDGTLFRLPLRTEMQAVSSDIKKFHYSKQEVIKLLNMFMRSAGNLFLFTQNIQNIEVFYLSPNATSPKEKVLLFSANKTMTETIPKELHDINILKYFASKKNKNVAVLKFFQIHLEVFDHALELCNLPMMSCSTRWYVAWALSNVQDIHIKGGLPVGATAIPIEENEGLIYPMKLLQLPYGFYRTSHIFCFLPLPSETTPLLVHINGYFAVGNDRKALTVNSSDEKDSDHLNWNQALLSNSVCDAFLNMLSSFAETNAKRVGHYEYAAFWPKLSSNNRQLETFFVAFYQKVVFGEYKVFYENGKWFSFRNCAFLDPKLRSNKTVGDAAFLCFLRFHLKENVVDIGEETLKCFKAADCAESVEQRTMKVETFYENVFFPNLPSDYWHLSENRQMHRNNIVLYALDSDIQKLEQMIKRHECIPTAKCGTLRKPEELVHPKKRVSVLFDESDERFPTKLFSDERRLTKLSQLGMKTDRIPVSWMVERARSIQLLSLTNPPLALKRCNCLLEYLKYEVEIYDLSPFKDLLEIEFLPIEFKPSHWPFIWGGDSETLNPCSSVDELFPLYTSPEKLFLPEFLSLIGSVNLIAHSFQKKEYDDVLKRIGVNHYADIQSVFRQLQIVSESNVDQMNVEERKKMRIVCYSIYQYIENHYQDVGYQEEIKQMCQNLSSSNILCTSDTIGNPVLITPDMMANLLTVDCRPALFYTDSNLRRYEHFFNLVGVREKFPFSYITHVIKKQKTRIGDEVCKETDVQLIINLLRLLDRTCKAENITLSAEQIKEIVVPDDANILRSPNDLCFDEDYGSLGKMKFMNFVHPDVGGGLMKMLGIQSKRSKHLESFGHGIKFGQKENLITRLKGLLQNYPCDSTILNELLQNADDAGASTIHFIFDKRRHSTDGVFCDSWKSLQGPAVLVYNDTCFTESDITGIQNLGEGSKSDDATKTGQFGLGFNATYHLTDVPSFLTRGGTSPNGGTLCIFDPHCTYAPLATLDSPGMQLPDLSVVEECYPGVYHTYLQRELPSEKGTWFRFPLRSHELSRKSKIRKDKETSVSHIEELFTSFMRDMSRVLLFVSNVQEIKISHISSAKTQLITLYTVKTIMSDEDIAARSAFNAHVKMSMGKLKNGDCFMSDVEDKEVIYKMAINDSSGQDTEWMIVQRFGPKNKSAVSNLTQAVKDGEIGLSPRGGVAIPLFYSAQSKPFPLFKNYRMTLPKLEVPEIQVDPVSSLVPTFLQKQHHMVSSPTQSINTLTTDNSSIFQTTSVQNYSGICHEKNDIKDKRAINEQTQNGNFRAFCFLPTPIKTGLPVHINGHFVLDPARRNLWREDNYTSIKGEWNEMIIEEIIPESYKTGIEQVKNYTKDLIQNTDVSMEDILHFYHLVFPAVSDVREDRWQKLVISLYKCIFRSETELFPITNNNDSRLNISWVALQQSGHAFPAYFNNLVSQLQNDTEETMDQQRNPFCKVTPENPEIIKHDDLCLQSIELGNVLRDLGLKLINSPLWIFESIEDCSVKVETVSAESVVRFLKSTALEEPDKCKIDPVVKPLGETIFKSFFRLKLVLKYCLQRKLYVGYFDQMPLLVTQDGMLRFFSSNTPVYISKFCRLLRGSREKFVHEDFVPLLQTISEHASFLKKFHVEDFASLLQFSMDPHKYGLNITIQWNENQFPDKAWIKLFWDFLSDCKTFCTNRSMCNTSTKFEGMCKDKLQKWSLIPCMKDGKTYLTSFDRGETIISTKTIKKDETREAFQRLELLVPHNVIIDSPMLPLFVATAKRPMSILKCLHFHRDQLQHLKVNDHVFDRILIFFSENFDNLNKTLLRELPLFKMVSGIRKPIDLSTALIIPRNVPISGLDIWSQRVSKQILAKNSFLEIFLENLGVQSLSALSFYTEHLLATFSDVDRSSYLEHLTYVKDTFLPINEKNKESMNLWQQLTELRFIESESGTLLRASNFFSPHNNVCANLCHTSDFPPAPFDSKEWEEFMNVAGIKNEITDTLFIEFAKQIEKEGSNGLKNDTLKKSEVLISHLFERNSLTNSGLLGEIKNIKFVVCDLANKELSNIYPYLKKEDLIQFSESVPETCKHLVWTTCQILPRYADPSLAAKYILEMPEIDRQLEIHRQPILQKVISHVHNVCYTFHKYHYNTDVSSSSKYLDSVLVQSVMSDIYTYMESHGRNEKTVKGLSQTPFIHIDEHNQFCYIDQIVQEFTSKDEIVPLLFRAPVFYGKYFKLFEYLGSEKEVTCKHYAKVLERQKALVGEGKLNLAEKVIVGKAMFGLFKESDKDFSNLKELDCLYLPSENQTLRKSCELVFCNSSSIKTRCRNVTLDFIHYMTGMPEENNFYSSLLHLPQHLRPKMLTSLVKEELVEVSRCCKIENSENAAVIVEFLRSNYFLDGVSKIILKEYSQKSEEVSMDKISEARQSIGSIVIYPVSNLQTQLVYQNVVIDSSQKRTTSFFSQLNDEWIFYFQDDEGDIQRLLPFIKWRLSDVINRCSGGLIKRNVHHLREIVGCLGCKDLLKEYLEEHQINIGSTFESFVDEWFPQLGSFIPEEEHIFLDNSFTIFRKGEPAAYELYDPEIDGETNYDNLDASNSVYIYVKILKESVLGSSGEQNPYLRRYDVNMGEGRIESVLVVRLYKFIRKREDTSTDLITFTDGNQGSNTAQEETIFERIWSILLDAWQLDKPNRKRVIKRLFLNWHPDKNPGNEEFCTRVFQYIQEVIRQLENKEINFNIGSCPSYSSWHENWSHHYGQSGSTYSGHWYSFGERVRSRYRKNWTYYRDNGSRRRSRTSHYYEPYVPSPQAHEAKRWMKQAKFDLIVAEGFSRCSCEDLKDINAYNWICFICHQAAEKALKAAVYNLDSNKVTKTHSLSTMTHYLSSHSLEEKARALDDHLIRYNRMRYPDVMEFPKIAPELYDKEKADEALKQAKDIIEEIDQYLV